ncbi:GNAT family N-acetyltransferase [Pseudotabrizicola formosa]|uniref:GNAT family N-acetyltransferase n=1 Tax=Pseudotabrizicola formosa TaxID=2030009 RepID=UPI001FEEB027|nr:GNAT family N-acetyltransferase [Pseudotabrizicola formosa]
MHVSLGLPEHLKSQAADLYWQAFGGKLGRVMGPEPRAHAFLLRVMRADHCICALSDDGDLLGIAGFKSAQGSFAGGAVPDLQAVYGRVGAVWRGSLLRLLQTDVDNERFLIDGLCVAPDQRGRGVGTVLVAALIAEAVRRGYPAIRLEVIDTNIRARALYERLGFAAFRSETLGPLRHVFGFSRAVSMVRSLP